MANKVILKASDGTTVEFYDEIKAQGGVKDVYFSIDKTYVVAFYRKTLSPSDKNRLENIVGPYHKRIFETVEGKYWKDYLIMPDRLVEWNGNISSYFPQIRIKFSNCRITNRPRHFHSHNIRTDRFFIFGK